MHHEQFPVPDLPNMAFSGVSFETLNRNAPNPSATAQWYARLGISLAFTLFTIIVIVSCYIFALTDDIFFIVMLTATAIFYLISLSLMTRKIVSSDRVTLWIKTSKNHYFINALTNTPLDVRLATSNNLWDALRSDEWINCINYAHAIDRPRTVHCCQQIGKIASHLNESNPELYCDAMLKVMSNQRGSARYFFDILIMLSEQQFHDEHVNQKKVRSTQTLMLDDIFSHR